MRVAVTGAGGYVGANLVRRLCSDGYDVVAADRNWPDPGGAEPALAPRPQVGGGTGIRHISADVLDSAAMRGAFDLVDVRDVVDGLVRAERHGRTGENYLLAGEMVSMHKLLAARASAVGRRGPIGVVPLALLRILMPIFSPIGVPFDSDVMNVSSLQHLETSPAADGSKARAEIGYRPRLFIETVRDLVAEYVVSGTLARRGRSLARV